MNQKVMSTLTELKARFLVEGFEIIGVFGSFARNEETGTSDVDIAYRVADAFLARFPGFNAFVRLEEIREEIQGSLGRQIDLAPVDSPSRTFSDILKRDLVHV